MSKMYVNLPVQSAKLEAVGPGIDGGSDIWKTLFDAATEEYCRYAIVVPSYASGLTLDVHYSLAAAIIGTVQFGVYANGYSAGALADLDAVVWGTQMTANANVTGTAGDLQALMSIALGTFGGPASALSAGDLLLLRFSRPVVAPSATGDAELRNLLLSWTTT